MSRQEVLRTLVANMGFEVIPFKSSEHQVIEHLDRSVPLSVTTTVAKGIERTLDVAIHLRENGFDPSPHLAARLFRDADHVAEVVERLRAGGVERIFVIGGDAPQPAGPYDDALGLLQALQATGHGFREVGVGGYPEGHPNFSSEIAERALYDKAAYAHKVITQMCFDPGVTTGWAQRMVRDGVGLKVVAGMPGPVNRQKLVRISASLGLGSSARFLQKQHGLWRFLLPGAYNPTRLLKGLAAAQPSAAPLITGIHVFTFNEFAGAAAWRRSLRREVGLD